MKTKLLASLTAIAFTTITFTACQKDADTKVSSAEEESATIATVEANAESDVAFDDVFNNVMGVSADVALGGTGVFGGASTNSNGELNKTTACYTVTVTPLTTTAIFPLKVVIDFAGGCLGRDGRVRRGKIITEYSSRLINPGATAVTTFDGYFLDSVKIEGTHKITNTSTASVRQFTVDVTGAQLTRTSGNYTQCAAHRVISQTEGLGTPDYPLDDVFKVEGSASGTVKRANIIVAWRSDIGEPLVKKFACRWISKGTITIKRETLTSSAIREVTLDFGNGDCDNKALLNINGKVLEILLH